MDLRMELWYDQTRKWQAIKVVNCWNCPHVSQRRKTQAVLLCGVSIACSGGLLGVWCWWWSYYRTSFREGKCIRGHSTASPPSPGPYLWERLSMVTCKAPWYWDGRSLARRCMHNMLLQLVLVDIHGPECWLEADVQASCRPHGLEVPFQKT